MSKQPLAEVFGFPIDNMSAQASRHRKNKLCPHNNRVPNCTKDKANDPLGVCSIHYGKDVVITCPIRFRQEWLIADDASRFFFPEDTSWTSLTEVRLKDAHGQSAGNIDVVLVAYDQQGQIIDFGTLEVQAVYISGNVRRPFAHYMSDPANRSDMDWAKLASYYPRPDFLSSSRKRLAPQLLYKGSILRAWGKKQAVAIQSCFYDTLPNLPEVDPSQAEIAWFLYDLTPAGDRYDLTLNRVIYTEFWPALNTITTPDPGTLEDFIDVLQNKLDDQRGSNPPDTSLITDIPLQ
jgi:hypothetical protein